MRSAFIVDNPNGAALRALNYTPEVERLRRRRGSDAILLSDLLEQMGPAYGSVFVRVDCEREHGVELITQGDMFAAEPTGRVIRLNSMARPERHRVRRWQVLIAGAGTLGENELYGRAIIADGRLEGSYVGPHAMVLTFQEPESDQALFTYAFLLTGVGLRAIRATSFGTKILGLRKDLLGALPIPKPDGKTMERVASLVRRTVECRESYMREFRAARAVVESLPEMQEAHAMCCDRRARAVSWSGPMPTLSAWTYASAGGALELLRRRWSGRLQDALQPDGVFNGPRFARIECNPPHGVDFYSQRDVFLMRPIPRRIARPAIAERQLFVPKDAVLAGSHGQLTDGGIFGKVELASFGAYRGGLTQDLLRLLFRPAYRAAAFAFLAGRVGERLLKATAVGTSIPSMRLDLLKEIPFPDLSKSHVARIETHVSAAETARVSAGDAESEAVRIIEEEVMPAWLD